MEVSRTPSHLGGRVIEIHFRGFVDALDQQLVLRNYELLGLVLVLGRHERTDELIGGAEIEGFGSVYGGLAAPVENGGFESEVGDYRGEIGWGRVHESGCEVEGFADLDAGTLEGVA